MSKRFIVAAVAGSVTMLLVGFLLYGLVFAGLFREGALTMPGVMKQSPEILWIVAGFRNITIIRLFTNQLFQLN